MIIWLASYPKSGNTWVRLFLNSLINDKTSEVDINNIQIRQFPLRYDFSNLNIDMDNIQEFISNCIVCQDKINLDNSIKIFKTHNAFWRAGNNQFTNEENTKGVIHIVRDPRNIITSFKNHFFLRTYNEALALMKNENVWGGELKKNEVPHLISSWEHHFESWAMFTKNYILFKYEDIQDNPKKQINRLIEYLQKFIKINPDAQTIDQIIKDTNFENLKSLEKEGKFLENSIDYKTNNKATFFNLGPKNDYKKLLDKEIQIEIEKRFKDTMKKLNYLE
jgi:hypothetical protein